MLGHTSSNRLLSWVYLGQSIALVSPRPLSWAYLPWVCFLSKSIESIFVENVTSTLQICQCLKFKSIPAAELWWTVLPSCLSGTATLMAMVFAERDNLPYNSVYRESQDSWACWVVFQILTIGFQATILRQVIIYRLYVRQRKELWITGF